MPTPLPTLLRPCPVAAAGVVLVLGIALVWRWSATPDPVAASPFRLVWTFEPPERGGIAAGVTVTDDSVLVTLIRDNGLHTSGAVSRLDRFTGQPRWLFDDSGTMLHSISRPLLADDRVYVGEGMHGDVPCRLYCLDAVRGTRIWDHPVGGHIESGPRRGDGLILCTAGDAGVRAIDAGSGEPRWHYTASGHVDAPPYVQAGRLYGGSGISRQHRRSEAFCLDAASGRPVWRVPTPLPVWGGPVVAGDSVLVPLGNGRLTSSEEPPGRPAGGLLCLDASSGEQRWRFDVADSVMAAPTVTAAAVLFTSRDGWCYAVDRQEGRLVWKHDLGSPVVTMPQVVAGQVYIASSEGLLAVLDAASGERLAAFDVAARFPSMPRILGSPAVAIGRNGLPRVYLGTELRGAGRPAAVLLCLEVSLALPLSGR